MTDRFIQRHAKRTASQAHGIPFLPVEQPKAGAG